MLDRASSGNGQYVDNYTPKTGPIGESSSIISWAPRHVGMIYVCVLCSSVLDYRASGTYTTFLCGDGNMRKSQFNELPVILGLFGSINTANFLPAA